MLTIKENFLETIRGGEPERFVKQYEYQAWLRDPIMPVIGGVRGVGTFRNGWGVKIVFREGLPGPFPCSEGEDKVCKDITCWQDFVKAPDIVLGPEAWEPCIAQAREIDRNEKFVSAVMTNGLFEKLHFLMGMEDTMVNFYDEPEAMHDLIDYLTEFELRYAEEVIKYVHPELLHRHDDWGSQRSLFISKEMFDEFLLGPTKKIYKFWKDNGVEIIVHHSDSYAAELVPDMIDMGVDVWQGAVTDNNIPELLKKYGGQISIHGGLDNGKYDMADWDENKVRQGIRNLIDSTGTKYIIPGLTAGGPASTFPGLYQRIDEILDELSPEYF